MRVYIAGRMTGVPGWNFPAFHAAAHAWRNAGWDAVNPAESFDGATDLPYPEYVAHDLALLRTCDAIAMLPGWDDPSARGSVWEREVARSVFGLPVYDADAPAPPPKRETIAHEALEAVHGDRGRDYGHPRLNHGCTAALWSAYLSRRYRTEIRVDAKDVCILNILQKISREANAPKRDSWVDMVGYALNAEMLDDPEPEE